MQFWVDKVIPLTLHFAVCSSIVDPSGFRTFGVVGALGDLSINKTLSLKKATSLWQRVGWRAERCG